MCDLATRRNRGHPLGGQAVGRILTRENQNSIASETDAKSFQHTRHGGEA